MTHDTFGLPGFGSSRSADLQRVLVSRCQALLGSSGSTLYAMTWTLVDTPSPPSISRLAASALRTSGSGCGGWATPQASDDTEGSRTAIDSRQKGLGRDLKMMTGWATPRANDGTGAQVPPGREGGVALKTQAGWATPAARDYKGATEQTYAERGGGKNGEALPAQVRHFMPGATLSGSSVPTDEQGRSLRLNPRFSLWLQGYPATWADCAEPVTRSSRK